MKKVIIAIVGPSGSGKTTVAEYIQKKTGVPAIVSCTTRPMRNGEHQGKEHWFVTADDVPSKSDMIAYTLFAGNQYWVSRKDMPDAPFMTYVIDEKGLMMLMEDHSDEFDIVPILIKRPAAQTAKSVGAERVHRDRCRVHIEEAAYEYIINNNSTLEAFEDKATAIIKKIIQKYGTNN